MGYASNALGTVNPVKEITRLAHQAGAQVYVDAVHYAPHGLIDVQDIDCDFLVCSAYKFFGPHTAYCREIQAAGRIFPYKVRPAPDEPPGKFETGTGNFECIAGILGALEYLQWVGETFGGIGRSTSQKGPSEEGRRGAFTASHAGDPAYETSSRARCWMCWRNPGVTIYGLTDRKRLDERVPTAAINLKGGTRGGWRKSWTKPASTCGTGTITP